MKSFCEILRELREDRDMTQADVANLLGTSQQYYSKYETGKYEMPIHYVVPLADFYGVLSSRQTPKRSRKNNAIVAQCSDVCGAATTVLWIAMAIR